MGELQGAIIRDQVGRMLDDILQKTTRNLELSIRDLANLTLENETLHLGNSITDFIVREQRKTSSYNSEIPHNEGSILRTSNQLKAARALIGLGQIALAERAGLNVNTIRRMEAEGFEPLQGLSANVQAVQRALEKAGVEFLGGDRPGVRLRRNYAQTS